MTAAIAPVNSDDNLWVERRSTMWIHDNRDWLSTFASEFGLADVNERRGFEESFDEEAPVSVLPHGSETTSEKERWQLFTNICEAIVYTAKWRERLTSEQRKGLLDRVVELFFEHGNNVETDKVHMRTILSTIRSENRQVITRDTLVEFMNGAAWKKDSFRQKSNFLNPKDYEAFKGDVEAKVQERLHILNQAMSSEEDRRVKVMNNFNHIVSNSPDATACFGNMLTVFFENIKFNDGSYKRRKLPSTVSIAVELTYNNVSFGEVFLRKKAATDETGQFASWDEPQPVGIFLGPPETNEVPTAELIVRLKAVDLCGLFQFKTISTIRIPLSYFYSRDRLEPLGSRLRQSNNIFGLHVFRGHFFDPHKGFGVTAASHMKCWCEEHNPPIPFFDPMMPLQPAQAIDAKCVEVWHVDHHRAFIDLLELFGEINDVEYTILDLYADRFFLHPELLEIGAVCAAVVNGNFSDQESREYTCFAVEQLAKLTPTVKCKVTLDLLQNSLRRVRQQMISRLCCLEETCGPGDAEDTLRRCIMALQSCGLSQKDLPGVVDTRTKNITNGLVRNIKKLQTTFSSARKDDRLSRLSEFERSDDKTTTGKVALLLTWMQQTYKHLRKALQFANESRSHQVLAFALRRVDITLTSLIAPLQSFYAISIAEMVNTATTSPLGETFAVWGVLFTDTFDMAKEIYEYEALQEVSPKLLGIFETFLSNWMVLCQIRTKVLLDTVVNRNALEPSAPGKRFANGAPTDAMNIFDQLIDFFDRCTQMSDPSSIDVNLPTFCSILGKFVEQFVGGLSEKGKRTNDFLEHLVCMSSLCKFTALIKTTWKERITEDLLTRCEQETVSKCTQIYLIATGTLGEVVENYAQFIQDQFKKWFSEVFRFAALENKGDSAFCVYVKDSLETRMETLRNNVDRSVLDAHLVLPCAEATHDAFVAYVANTSTTPKKDHEAKKLYELLGIIENVAADPSHGSVSQKLHDLSLRSRKYVQLSCLSSSDLVRSFESSEISQGEKEWLLSILRKRSDKEASKLVRKVGAA